MKFIYLIPLLFIYFVYCTELGGVKFAITEKMAYDVLNHFYYKINSQIQKMTIEDIHIERGVNIREIEFGIPNFTQDKVKIKFKENGININISGLKAWLSCTLYVSNLIIPFHNNIKVDVREFSLNANLRLKVRNVNGKLMPDAEFIGTPSHSIDFDVDIDGFMFGFNGAVESKAKSLIKDKIDDFIKDKSNDFLKLGLSKIPTDLPIDEQKGYYIDFSLVDNIQMKNGYLIVNSYAFFYNKRKPLTQNKRRYPLSLLPTILKVNNPDQLYVSEYSINSALFTIFNSNPLSLKIDSSLINTGLLEGVLPGISSKFKGQKIGIDLESTKPATLELLENYINGKIYGKIILKAEGINDPIFSCEIEISTKVEIIVFDNVYVSGKINELNIKPGTVSINKVSSQFSTKNINTILPVVLPLLNDYIKKNIKITSPIFLRVLSIEHKNKYLAINYKIKKEVHYMHFVAYINAIQSTLKALFFKGDVYSFKNAATNFNKEIMDIYNKFFTDTQLKNKYITLTNVISKIPDTITDPNKRRSALAELQRTLSNMGNELSSSASQIPLFIEQTVGMSNIPPEGMKISENQLKSVLQEFVARIVCPIEGTLLNHINRDDMYFVMEKYDYSECFRKRNPRK